LSQNIIRFLCHVTIFQNIIRFLCHVTTNMFLAVPFFSPFLLPLPLLQSCCTLHTCPTCHSLFQLNKLSPFFQYTLSNTDHFCGFFPLCDGGSFCHSFPSTQPFFQVTP